jgi:hypothetical protein
MYTTDKNSQILNLTNSVRKSFEVSAVKLI